MVIIINIGLIFELHYGDLPSSLKTANIAKAQGSTQMNDTERSESYKLFDVTSIYILLRT